MFRARPNSYMPVFQHMMVIKYYLPLAFLPKTNAFNINSADWVNDLKSEFV